MRRVLAILLVLAICCSVLPAPAFASSAEDVAEAAAVLQMMGAMQGDGSGTLNLTGTLTRSQFCKIAVIILGLGTQVARYGSYTIFPDVPSSNWAAGYVNLAVRSAGIIKGYPSGYFGPNDPITFGQAVTVLMRMTGYTDADVGAIWPKGYIDKAAEIELTDGVSLTSGSQISRRQAAILFANLLNADVNGSDKTFASTISGATTVENVFLVANNATTDNGTTGAVKVAGETAAAYLPVNDVPDDLLGRFGTLVLNSNGKALTFVPADNGSTKISTVAEASASAITCSDGTKVSMTSSPAFYIDGEAGDYTESWYDIDKGMQISAYYSDGGTVQFVMVSSPESDSGTVSIYSGSSSSISSASKIYKNGAQISVYDICKYDVITYDSGYNIYYVSDNRITARYESAYPDEEDPSTITVMGTELEVLDRAVSSLSDFGVGDTVTLLLTYDNKVAGAVSASTLKATSIGVVTDASSSSATVELINGITVSGSISIGDPESYEGCMVAVSSGSTGFIYLSDLENASSGSIDLSAMTYGSTEISAVVRVFEGINNNAVVKISRDDISSSKISYANISYVGYDYSGKVNLILLDDVTGDIYTYGLTKTGTKTSTGSLSATNKTVAVTNSNGTTDSLLCSEIEFTTVIGIAARPDGHLAGYRNLTCTSGVSRYDFEEDEDGNLYINVNDDIYPVWEDVEVYNDSTETWTTLAKARSYSDNLSIYYDGEPEEGGKVRVIIAY